MNNRGSARYVSRLWAIFCWFCIVLTGTAVIIGSSGGDGGGDQSYVENNIIQDAPLDDAEDFDSYSLSITDPGEYDRISSDVIGVKGTYSHAPQGIRITIPKSSSGIDVIETDAVLVQDGDGGTFSGTLEISDIIGNGNRSLMAEAVYASPADIRVIDTIPVILVREGTGVSIESPIEGETVLTDYLRVLGVYGGTPATLSVTLGKDGSQEQLNATIVRDGNTFSAFFPDITGIGNGEIDITAKVTYSESVDKKDIKQVVIDRDGEAGKSLSYRFMIYTTADETLPVLVTRWNVCSSDAVSQPMILSPGVSVSGVIQYPLDQDQFVSCREDLEDIYERRIGVRVQYLSQVPEDYTFEINLFVNDTASPIRAVTSNNQSATLEIITSWDGESASSVIVKNE